MSDVKAKVGMSRKVLTLVYLLEDENILLGLKKRGFGEGKVSSHLSIKFQSKTHFETLNDTQYIHFSNSILFQTLFSGMALVEKLI